ncbi:hypothetical protein C8J56DRAFT_1043418 [Mycena floridula]|nr:hypothetical protein C8J56DRAFT_1043418 [Mycena floridula]
MPCEITETRAHALIYGSRNFIKAVQPLNQTDYNSKVRTVNRYIVRHMDGKKKMGEQSDKFELVMQGITHSFTQHLNLLQINNEDTLKEIRAFAVNKFQAMRKPFIGQSESSASEERSGGNKRKARDDSQETLNKAPRLDTSHRQPAASTSTSSARPSAVSKQVEKTKKVDKRIMPFKWVKRLPRNLDEVLAIASGSDLNFLVFKADLEKRFGYGDPRKLARMQKKKLEYLLDSLMRYQLVNSNGELATFSDCTFIVDAMLTPNLFPAD